MLSSWSTVEPLTIIYYQKGSMKWSNQYYSEPNRPTYIVIIFGFILIFEGSQVRSDCFEVYRSATSKMLRTSDLECLHFYLLAYSLLLKLSSNLRCDSTSTDNLQFFIQNSTENSYIFICKSLLQSLYLKDRRLLRPRLRVPSQYTTTRFRSHFESLARNACRFRVTFKSTEILHSKIVLIHRTMDHQNLVNWAYIVTTIVRYDRHFHWVDLHRSGLIRIHKFITRFVRQKYSNCLWWVGEYYVLFPKVVKAYLDNYVILVV